VPVERLGDGLYLEEATAHDRAFPLGVEVGAVRGVGLGPELAELFLVGPRSGGLEFDLQEIGGADLFGGGQLPCSQR